MKVQETIIDGPMESIICIVQGENEFAQRNRFYVVCERTISRVFQEICGGVAGPLREDMQFNRMTTKNEVSMICNAYGTHLPITKVVVR